MSIKRPFAVDPYDYLPPVPAFTLTSADIVDGEPINLDHVHGSAGGADESPELRWSEFPAETQSFVVTCFDPDAPVVSGFWHWFVADIPVRVTELPRGAGNSDASLPGGFHVRNDFGSLNYGGSAPPRGDHRHRYMFVVHALDVPTLGVEARTPAASAGCKLAFHTLARARITVTFGH